MAAITRLIELTPPPSSQEPRFEWEAVEEVLGPLPRDYKELVETYGPGSFDGFLWVLQPSANEHLDLVQRQRHVAVILGDLVFPADRPDDSTPEECLAVFSTDNGDYGL